MFYACSECKKTQYVCKTIEDAEHWQNETRAIEDKLSDALHERLTKRFVDRRTSVLMKRLRENTVLEAEIAADGSVMVEGHHVGDLAGFRFTPDASAIGPDAKAARNAAQKALASEIEARADRLAAASNGDFIVDSDGTVRWIGVPVARLLAGDETLKPRLLLLADEQLTGQALEKVTSRLERWIGYHVETHLKPLVELSNPDGLEGMARGVAFRVSENLGAIDRREIADDVKGLDQEQRGHLRRRGLRFGAYHIFTPMMIKPAAATLVTLLWAIKNDRVDAPGRDDIIQALAAGRTSMPSDAAFDDVLYRLCGYRVLGHKAVRIDILERLADLIRPAVSWRFNEAEPKPRPEGAWDGTGFTITPAMLSILGATHEDMTEILKGLGYRNETMLEDDASTKLADWDKAAGGTDAEKTDDALAKSSDPSDQIEPAPLPTAEAALSEETEAADEPKRIDIWRPARTGSNRQSGRHQRTEDTRGTKRRAKGPGKGKFSAGPGDKGPKGDSRKVANRLPKREKEPDPDSPFAKLEALKKSLESSNG